MIDFLRGLPKVELHVHLEGAAPLETMAAIYARHGCSDLATADAVREFVRHDDFASFLQRFRHFLTWLRSIEDYEFLTDAVLRNLASEGVRYAELTVSLGAASFFHGLDRVEVLKAIQRGYESARQDTGIQMGVLVDLIRNLGPEAGWEAARFAAAHRDLGVVGINLGGDEANFPAEAYAEIYAFANGEGLGTTAHAGEGAGAASVWACVDELGSQRIGHGTRSVEDPALIKVLAARGITIEVCPSSNLSTGVVPTMKSHPVGRLLQAGCQVCLNTDDPTFFGCTLTEELMSVASAHRLGRREMVDIQKTAIQAAFASAETKARLTEELYDYVRRPVAQT